jgi:hypothetical protein
MRFTPFDHAPHVSQHHCKHVAQHHCNHTPCPSPSNEHNHNKPPRQHRHANVNPNTTRSNKYAKRFRRRLQIRFRSHQSRVRNHGAGSCHLATPGQVSETQTVVCGCGQWVGDRTEMEGRGVDLRWTTRRVERHFREKLEVCLVYL